MGMAIKALCILNEGAKAQYSKMRHHMDQRKQITMGLLIKNAIYSLGLVWRMSKLVVIMRGVNMAAEAIIPLIQAFVAGSLVGEVAAIPAGNGNQEKCWY